ncbi:hypothetical protein Pmani_008965 [Petrolisthes manimaculis]|uniref:PID domain-containing protein n=1 Tax=Petrolisthes manimaculis TaxID=1843537 RepID=A0AAE1Q5S6_9EUCA|nr:hypothetical protein Pmani_008965 [Petrolisthes manimaculis]
MSSLLRALFNGSSKHKKLSEEWATIREPVVEGVTFYCKYLGSTLVDDPKGEAATAEAIKRIIHIAKQVARKPEPVSLHVSLEGIKMEDSTTNDLLLQTSIYKISYCSADAHYDHVFAFIATNDNDTCECHAFLCPKRKMAQAVTISIAQAFNLAYDYWKMSLDNKNSEEIFAQEELPAEVTVASTLVHSNNNNSTNSQPSSLTSSPIPIRSDFGSSDMSTSGYQSSTPALLIDLEDSTEQTSTSTVSSSSNAMHHQNQQHHQNDNQSSTFKTPSSILSKPLNGFDDLTEVCDDFSRLALRRENGQLPGTSPLALTELDLAVFMAPPLASPTENGCWPSVSFPVTGSSPSTSPIHNSPHPTSPTLSSPPPTSPTLSGSPTASSPVDPWFFGQTHTEEISRSPNTAFLHSCQSPPSHVAFSTIMRPVGNDTKQSPFLPLENNVRQDSFFPSDCTQNVFPQQDKVEGMFSSSPFHSDHKDFNQNNPFLSSQDLNPFHTDFSSYNRMEARMVVTPPSPQLTGSSCGSVQPAWNGDLFQGRKVSDVDVCMQLQRKPPSWKP